MGYLTAKFRPSGLPHREFCPGIDLPAEFHYHLKALDPDLYCVWHPFKTLYDDTINVYYGSLDDPRYLIAESFGQEVWGFVMTNGAGDPLYDETWHVWRKSSVGWHHIIGIESKESSYLDKVLDSIWDQKLVERYGRKAILRMKEAKEEARIEKENANKAQDFKDVQKENRGMLAKVMDNFQRKNYAPTNQTVETISSYSNQVNRSRIIRPSEDSDGGLVGWDGRAGRVR